MQHISKSAKNKMETEKIFIIHDGSKCTHTPDTWWRTGARREEKVKRDEEGGNLNLCWMRRGKMKGEREDGEKKSLAEELGEVMWSEWQSYCSKLMIWEWDPVKEYKIKNLLSFIAHYINMLLQLYFHAFMQRPLGPKIYSVKFNRNARFFFVLKLMQSHTHTHTHTHMDAHAHTHTHTHTYAHAHKQKGTNTAEALKSHTYTLKVVIHLRCQWQHLSMVYVCVCVHTFTRSALS